MESESLLHVVSRETINGITVEWIEGLTDAVRDSVRLWIERYPDLLPDKILGVGWDVSDTSEQDGMVIRPLRDSSGEGVLLVPSERWYQTSAEDREGDFVAAGVLHTFQRNGTLRIDQQGMPELHFNDRVLRSEEVLRFLEALVSVLVHGRSEYGGDGPAWTPD